MRVALACAMPVCLPMCGHGRVTVSCWFACQCAATVRVTVLPVQGGRFARPSTRSAYTYTPSGSSPAQLASPCFGPFRSALRNCGFVPKPCFCGLSARPSASPLKTLRVFRRLPDPNRGRAWHPREFGAVLGGSASLPLPAPPLPPSSRRNAPQCFVGGIPPPRLATCLTAHPTNRVAACRSVRHSPPRPLPHLP